MLTTRADKCYYDHYLINKVFIKKHASCIVLFHCANVELVIILGQAYLFTPGGNCGTPNYFNTAV